MTFPRLDELCIPEQAPLRQAIQAIDAGAVEIALVVKPGRELIGTVSDGDVRRALLGGAEIIPKGRSTGSGRRGSAT